jgi:hypothetical protein
MKYKIERFLFAVSFLPATMREWWRLTGEIFAIETVLAQEHKRRQKIRNMLVAQGRIDDQPVSGVPRPH